MTLSTIAAVATGSAPGGVGILRVSGPEALSVARVVAPGLPEKPVPRHAYVVRLEDGRGGLLDEGLALHFPAPRSYTGEDVVELHAHGSPRLLSLLLSGLLSTGRARLAEPGEFTRRAFMNGRLDLQRAEAVADLVAAESEAAVRAAAAQVTGALSGRLAPCLEGLRALHADLEAVLSFPDESEGVEAGLPARVREEAARVEALSAEAARGRVVRRGARVVLVGPPNAGKSTLFNRLLGEERALVDDAPGTTRDALEARLELDDLAVALVDTAGLREAPGRLEALGVARARKELAAADLVLLLLPPGEDPLPWRSELPDGPPRLELRGKADVVPPAELGPDAPRATVTSPGRHAASAVGVAGAVLAPGSAQSASGSTGPALKVSGLTGEGVDALRDAVRRQLLGDGIPGAVAFATERHAECLRRAAESLRRAVSASELSTLEVVAGEVGLGLHALLEMTGEDATEALLDDVFRRFCIGK